jgi:hypothetical protein
MNEPADPIEAEHQRLIVEQEQLMREHRVLEDNPSDTAAHREHSRKLRAHIEALNAHMATLRQRDKELNPRRR